MEAHPVVIVLEIAEDEAEAVKHMHRYARNLRRRRVVNRYGVFIERHGSMWRVCLKDREGNRRDH